jgi:hypothetical protein
MTSTLFTDGWSFRRSTDTTSIPVRLPHDAMIAETRSAEASTGNHGGYFPGGAYVYTKQWQVPESDDEVEYRLFFEGVYGDTVVTVDGREVARCDSGYRAFPAAVGSPAPGSVLTIEVTVDNTRTPNSRWYTGSGIYRPVWLEVVPAVHIRRDGIHLVTRSISPEGIVDVDVHVTGELSPRATVHVELVDDETVVEAVDLPIRGSLATGQLRIRDPHLWSAEDPHLYQVAVQLVDGEVLDEHRLSTGLRTIQVDAVHGLRVNGRPVLLRGACVHHDNGILGALTLPAAEYRRARILKEAGFNAIRSAHNPLSRAFLDACDQVGLYVMNELTDVWFVHKTPHDGANRFEDTWQDDVRSMVADSRNRPSVILYSIGNEISETATDRGVATAARIHEFLQEADPTRPTTVAVNMLLNMMAGRGKSPFEGAHYQSAPGTNPATSTPKAAAEATGPEKPTATSTIANAITARLGRIMELAARLPAADKVSRDVFTKVDVAGYNYAFSRYAADRKKYPARVILGTESMPGDLPAIWERVQKVPGVIGDFMWTGWDYLGEAGIGVVSHGNESGGINKPYPTLLAGPGAFDITGYPGAPALLAQAVWGMLSAPAIAVAPLTHAGQRAHTTPWRTTDAITSWAWRGHHGMAHIQVYSCDDEVELLLNGRSLGRKRAGIRAGFVTRFRTPYAPGELIAVGYRGGRETGRSTLRSAGPAQLRVRAETDALTGADDLAYVWVELVDVEGIVETGTDDRVTISVEGPAELAGFGSAAPVTEESSVSGTHTTYYGRALAILRGTGTPGAVTVTVRSEHHGQTQLTLPVITMTPDTAELTARHP